MQKIKEGLRGTAKGFYRISLYKLKKEAQVMYNRIQSLQLDMPTIDWRIPGAMHHEEMINIMIGCYGKVILLAIDY